MAWPPPVLPIDQTNASLQQDRHPADHAAANLAINDLVVKVTDMGSVTPKFQEAPGIDKPLSTGALVSELYVPAHATLTRLIGVSVHHLVTCVATGGGFDLSLYAVNAQLPGGQIELVSWRIDKTGATTCSGFILFQQPASAVNTRVLVQAKTIAGGTSATVYGNPLFGRLQAFILRGNAA